MTDRVRVESGLGAPHVRYVKDYWNRLERFTDAYYTNEVDEYGTNKGRFSEIPGGPGRW